MAPVVLLHFLRELREWPVIIKYYAYTSVTLLEARPIMMS